MDNNTLMMQAKARRRRAEAEAAAAPQPQADFMGAKTDPRSGQKYVDPVNFSQGATTPMGKGAAAVADIFIANPINIISKGARDFGTALMTLPSDVIYDPLLGTNTGDTIRRNIPEFRTNSTPEDLTAVVGQYATGGKAGAQLLKEGAGGLSKMAASLAGMFAATDPNQASTLGDLVGGPTDLQQDDSALVKRTKVAAEGGVLNKVIDYGVEGSQALSRMAKSFLGPDDVGAARETLEAFERQGIEAPAAAIADNPTLSQAEQALSNLPTSAKNIRSQRERVIEGVQNKVSDLVGGKSASEIDAGKAIQEGADKYITDFKSGMKKRYDAFDAKVPAETRVGMNNTRAMLNDLQKTPDARAVAERTSNPALKALIDDVTGITEGKINNINTGLLDDTGRPITRQVEVPGTDGSLSYEAAKLLRDRVGAGIGDPALLGDIPRGELKRLYGALSGDIEAAIGQKAPQLLDEFSTLNKDYLEGTASIERTSGPLAGKDKAGEFKKTPESVYRETMGGQTSAERATSWRRLRQQLPADKWETVQAEEIRNLGVPNTGSANEFSVQTYMKKWRDMTPAEKEALFEGDKYAGMRKDLDDLDKIVGSLEKVEGYKNTSRTAPQGYFMSLLAGGGIGSFFSGGNPVGLVAGATVSAAAPYGASRLMTSPGFVKWLVEGEKQGVRNPSFIPAHLGRLTALADQEKDPETKKAILDYQKKAQESYKSNPPKNQDVQKPRSEAKPKVKEQLVSRIGELESNNKPTAEGKGSSALGTHQFIESTWQRMVNKYGREAGITMADRTDPKKSAYMAAKYAEENFDALHDRFGREPTDAELYMAHVLGAGGAARVVKEYNSGKTAAELFPDAAKAAGNKSLFFKDKRPKTVKEFYEDMAKKLAAA